MSNIKEVAIACWRLQKWLSSVDVERKIAAESSLRALKDFLSVNNVEVVDLTGEQYDPGLSVEVLFFEDEDSDSENIPTIIEMTQPIIIQNSTVIEFGQVVIAKKSQPLTSISYLESATEEKIDNDKIDIPKTKYKSRNYLKFSFLMPSLITITFCLTFFALLSNQIKSIERIDNNVSSIIKTQSTMVTDFNENILTGFAEIKEELNEFINDQAQKSTYAAIANAENKNSYKNDSVYSIIYIVKPGDNLYSICMNYNIDYNSWQNIINSSNGINNSNEIYIGQALLLPILSP